MKLRPTCLAVFFTVLLSACHNEKQQPLFELVEDSGIHFENNVEDGKLENSFLFRNFYANSYQTVRAEYAIHTSFVPAVQGNAAPPASREPAGGGRCA